MSDSGFACPKCDLKFPTSEQVAEHLRNEHVDGSQTERLPRRLIKGLNRITEYV